MVLGVIVSILHFILIIEQLNHHNCQCKKEFGAVTPRWVSYKVGGILLHTGHLENQRPKRVNIQADFLSLS
jgi:hypothetical protein